MPDVPVAAGAPEAPEAPEVVAALAFERLGADDLDAMHALHRTVLAATPGPRFLKPETPAFHRRVVEGAGIVYGVRDPAVPGALIAYGILLLELTPGDDTARELGLAPGEQLGKLAGSSVHPAARGRGLQRRLIDQRLETAFAAGRHHLYATVSPDNWVSWRNLLGRGFRLDSLAVRYGDLLRYIVYRPRGGQPAPSAAPVWCRIDRTGAQRELFARGLVGGACRVTADGFEVGFVPRA